MTTFLLLRHGSTDMLDRGISGRAPGIDLNPRGEREARALAHQLRKRQVSAIYASPLERTWQTAEAVAQQLGLTPIADEALLEIHYGEWTARSFESLDPNPHWRNYNSFRSGTRIPGGELMLETQKRGVCAILELREKHPDANIALVTHGDVIKSVVMYFLGIPLDFQQRLQVAPASYTEIELGSDFVRVVNFNTTVPEADEV